jgi:hypothetical protein
MISQKNVFIECDPAILPKDPVADRISQEGRREVVTLRSRWSELRTQDIPATWKRPMRRIRGERGAAGSGNKRGEDLSEAKRIKSKNPKNPKNPGTCRGAAPRGRET